MNPRKRFIKEKLVCGVLIDVAYENVGVLHSFATGISIARAELAPLRSTELPIVKENHLASYNKPGCE